MKETTIELVRAVLAGDETVIPQLRDNIMRVCRQTVTKRRLIGAKEVMGILQISRPRNFIQGGGKI